MAMFVLSVTSSPTRISPLTAGDQYSAQVIGDREVRFTSVTGTTAPTDLQVFGFAKPGDGFSIKEEDGESIWVWTPVSGQTSRLAVDGL